jgi:nicotinamidase-related amidase
MNIRKLNLFIGILLILGFPTIGCSSKASDKANVFTISTKSKSFFLLNKNGGLVPEIIDGKRFFKEGEDVYTFQRNFVSKKTALIVMDPWADSGSDFLNQYFSPIYLTNILPLVIKATTLKMPVIVLTNDPNKNNNKGYGSKVFPELEKMAIEGSLQILYHQDFDGKQLAKYLRDKGVNTLIYSGFSSNMCVIGRDTGMIPMKINGFKLYFIPKASAAVEFKDSWETGSVHKNTTSIISQGIAEIIELDDFLKLSLI